MTFQLSLCPINSIELLRSHFRFVYLENCGHVIHRESMDKWMSSKDEDSGGNKNLIGIKRCPKCKTIITTCVRYGNIIKKHFKDVLEVRNKIFGKSQIRKQAQLTLAKKIQINRSSEFENVKDFLERKLFTMKQTRSNNLPQIDLHILNVSVGILLLSQIVFNVC